MELRFQVKVGPIIFNFAVIKLQTGEKSVGRSDNEQQITA